MMSYWGAGENMGYNNNCILQHAYHRPYECAKGALFLLGAYNKLSKIRSVVSHSGSSIHAIQDPSHFYFVKYNNQIAQSDAMNLDFEGALLNLYENLVKAARALV